MAKKPGILCQDYRKTGGALIGEGAFNGELTVPYWCITDTLAFRGSSNFIIHIMDSIYIKSQNAPCIRLLVIIMTHLRGHARGQTLDPGKGFWNSKSQFQRGWNPNIKYLRFSKLIISTLQVLSVVTRSCSFYNIAPYAVNDCSISVNDNAVTKREYIWHVVSIANICSYNSGTEAPYHFVCILLQNSNWIY